jgi:F-type H+-transporting ATPase subunit delta
MKRSDEKKIGEFLFDTLTESKSASEDKRVIDAFVHTLTNKRLLDHADSILNELSCKIDETKGIIRADVIVSEPLSHAAQSIIRSALVKRYAVKDIILAERIDPTVIGGIKIKIKDEVFDATIKNRLVTLAKKLKV